MATVAFTLKHGLKVGDDMLNDVVMRELFSKDIFEASEASEKLVTVGEGKHASTEFVISPTRMSKETLCRQIKTIGNVQGPISTQMLGKLHPEDLELLEQYSQVLEGTIAPEEVAQRGRPDTAASSS